MKGKLIIISAPSGAGKTSIINYLMHSNLNLSFSVSATSRPPRHVEQHGVDYYFIEHEEFIRKVNNKEFIEWEEVYEGICYGTLKSEVERLIKKRKNVIFDVDVAGGINIKNMYGNRSLSIFIEPPSIEELRRRLTNRNTDSSEKIEERIAKAEYEITFAKNFDFIVINDNLQEACQKIEKIISKFINE